MNFFQRLKDHFAFTKNEQKVFLFLSIVFFSGVAIKIYKTYVVPPVVQQFDYTVTDSIFNGRSRLLNDDTTASSGTMLKKININNATKTELMTLPGVGEATAERIILFREEKGSFKHISEMKKVKGIGEKKFDKLKSHIEVK